MRRLLLVVEVIEVQRAGHVFVVRHVRALMCRVSVFRMQTWSCTGATESGFGCGDCRRHCSACCRGGRTAGTQVSIDVVALARMKAS